MEAEWLGCEYCGDNFCAGECQDQQAIELVARALSSAIYDLSVRHSKFGTGYDVRFNSTGTGLLLDLMNGPARTGQVILTLEADTGKGISSVTSFVAKCAQSLEAQVRSI